MRGMVSAGKMGVAAMEGVVVGVTAVVDLVAMMAAGCGGGVGDGGRWRGMASGSLAATGVAACGVCHGRQRWRRVAVARRRW